MCARELLWMTKERFYIRGCCAHILCILFGRGGILIGRQRGKPFVKSGVCPPGEPCVHQPSPLSFKIDAAFRKGYAFWQDIIQSILEPAFDLF